MAPGLRLQAMGPLSGDTQKWCHSYALPMPIRLLDPSHLTITHNILYVNKKIPQYLYIAGKIPAFTFSCHGCLLSGAVST